jgi:hypothetical protein
MCQHILASGLNEAQAVRTCSWGVYSGSRTMLDDMVLVTGRFGVVSEGYGVVGCETARRKLKRSWVEVVAR